MPESRFVLRCAGLAVFAASAIWLSVAVATAGLLGTTQPDVALRLAPFDARAKAAEAELLLAQLASPADLRRATRLAQSALARDPTVISAWRVLGLSAAVSGRNAEAATAFGTAERLSRRDLPTHLWLIEQRVREDDIPGALRQYDEAMRTSTEIREQLVPVLVSATASRYVVPYLARLLAQDPEWAPLYYAAFIQAPATGAGGAELAEHLRRLNPGLDLSELRPLPALLAQHGQFEQAQRAYRALSGAGTRKEMVRNGGFERANKFPAVEWELSNESNLIAEAAAVDGASGKTALEIRADYGAGGTAARQLLFLTPGPYRLQALVGAASDKPLDQLTWRVSCANNGAELLERNVARQTPGRQRTNLSFDVPGNCPAQWLNLDVQAGDAPGEAENWVDDIAVLPNG